MTLAPASVITWEVGDMSRLIPSHDVVVVRQADAEVVGIPAVSGRLYADSSRTAASRARLAGGDPS